MQTSNITTRQRLEAIRASSSLSDREIGELVGLNQSNVWRLRNGLYKSTTDEVGFKIADLYARILKQKNE